MWDAYFIDPNVTVSQQEISAVDRRRPEDEIDMTGRNILTGRLVVGQTKE